MPIQLSQKEILKLNTHVTTCYPQEACGVIINNEFHECLNAAVNPKETFKILAIELLEKSKLGEIQAIIHSHCVDPNKSFQYDPRWISSNDMRGWIGKDIPWGIVAANGRYGEVSPILWYDDNNILPLEGREFVHGFTDCYSIIRDYYRINMNITLNNYPRSFNWWENGDDLYNENFAKEGFVEVNKEEAQVGDVVLFKVRSPVINHAGVITGPNQLLHHLIHRLSYTDKLNKWHSYIQKVIRRQC